MHSIHAKARCKGVTSGILVRLPASNETHPPEVRASLSAPEFFKRRVFISDEIAWHPNLRHPHSRMKTHPHKTLSGRYLKVLKLRHRAYELEGGFSRPTSEDNVGASIREHTRTSCRQILIGA